MEKTIQITIASTGFSLAHEAYAKLESYLARLKAHFQGATGEEIVRDIESRIAEKLLHKRGHVIREDDIDAVIAEIGDVGQFEDEETEDAPARGSRKLYRDKDDAWIAGVASGIAAYFDVDPLWVRLLFLASVFFGGTGILLYIVLWVLIPEARTPSQKLEMRGHAVTIEGIARVVTEGVESARESGAVQRFFAGVRRVVRGLIRVFGKASSIVLVAGSFFALIGVMVALGVILTNWNAPYNDFPLRGIVAGPLLLAGLAAGAIAVFIPLVAVFALGIRLWNRRTIIPGTIAFGLIGIWALAIAAAGTIGVKAAGEYFEYTKTAPEYQETARTLDLAPFQDVRIVGTGVVIRSGETQTVTVSGRERDMGNVAVTVADGILTVADVDTAGMCLFCSHATPEVIITTPDLASVHADDGVVSFDGYADQALEIGLVRANLRGSLETGALAIAMEGASMRIDAATESLTLAMEDSFGSLDGDAAAAMITLEDSSLQADDFRITEATLSADASRAEVYAAQLAANDDPESRIINRAPEQD